MAEQVRAEIYPPGPPSIPPDLIAPSNAYRSHAYLAVAGLLGFVALYFALAGWLAWLTVHLVSLTFSGSGVSIGYLIAAAMSGLLAVFMLKALFFIKRGSTNHSLEVTAAEQPALFAFLYRIADEAKAPRPHRVFVSSEVNAGVSYDLSLLNLIVPTRKNLMIGLGLVNALTLSEFKAVLAHEFGHFAQRTMAIGRWVYMAQQVAAHIVAKRDALDEFLLSLSRMDPRIAWVGWILRLIIWSIRSLVETVFAWVLLAERALSREMERQADLVSVSLTGSDALVHALHRLGPADTARERALAFIQSEAVAERALADLIAIQDRVLSHMRTILDDPSYGGVPPVPPDAPRHRLFKARLAHPPRMWSSHPPNEEREENAKRVYLATELDDRSAWTLFASAQELREAVTTRLYLEGKRPENTPPLEESLATLDQDYQHPYFDPRYRGAYLGRSSTHDARQPHELYDAATLEDPGAAHELHARLAALYPPSLSEELAKRRELLEEQELLQALERGLLDSAGRRIRHRGEEYHRRDLPRLLAQTKRELADVNRVICAHDRACRTTHLLAARALGGGWEERLRALLALLHYAQHRELSLDDALGVMHNAISVATADGRVSDRERRQVLRTATDLYEVLRNIHDEAVEVVLSPELTARLGNESWEEKLGELKLATPSLERLGPWLSIVDSWAVSASLELAKLRNAVLAVLLLEEARVAEACAQGVALESAGPAPGVPLAYAAFPPGSERPIQWRLGWWDRFATADGFVPAAARFTVAGSILATVLAAGWVANHEASEESRGAPPRVVVYNGLARIVQVSVGSHVTVLPGDGHVSFELPDAGVVQVRAVTEDGAEIEAFSEPVWRRQRYVYDVARAAPLVEWTATYGAVSAQEPRRLGNPRWSVTRADHLFEAPPESVYLQSGGSEKRVVVSTEPNTNVTRSLRLVGERSAFEPMAEAHARWDDLESATYPMWLAALSSKRENQDAVLAERLRQNPNNPMLRIFEISSAEDRPSLCEKKALKDPTEDPISQHLAALCIIDLQARADAILALSERFPKDAWIARSAGYTLENRHRWSEAVERLSYAKANLPQMNLEVDLARVRRASSQDARADISDLTSASGYLQILDAAYEVEAGAPDPYQLLRDGDLAGAARTEDDPTLLVLVAASDGASEELVRRAAGLPLEEHLPGVAAALGLALRSGADPAPARAKLVELLREDGPAVSRFLDHLPQLRSPEAAARELADVDIERQGFAYEIAVISLGDKCPGPWRDLAKRVLFARERPYFR